MDKRNFIFSMAAIALMAVLVANPAFAQGGEEVGSSFFESLQGMIVGNIGLFIGLMITVLGIWTWVIKQQTGAGVTMIIGGVLITLAPGLFNSARNLVSGALDTVEADSSDAKYTVNP